MKPKDWKWAYIHRLEKASDNGSNQYGTVKALIDAGLLLPAARNNTVKFNMNHPDAFFASWIVDRLYENLIKKGRPFVNSTFLYNEMKGNSRCQQFGIGQTRQEAVELLKKAENTGHIISQLQPYPKKPWKMMKTWMINH